MPRTHAVGTVRFFSVRYEFPTEWAKFLSQTPTPTRRAELSVTLREEHYPLWNKGLRKKTTVELIAKSSKLTPPQTLTIADWIDDQPPPGTAAATVSTDDLEAKPELNGLLVRASNIITIPPSGVGELTIYFEDNALQDLWIAATWSG